MDFLDSVELELTRKMSLRMRSWYLYEQFKELERNQLVAAEQLREKADQDRYLRQELNERRERRRLCSDCSSNLKLIQSDRSFAAASDDSFFYPLQDDELIRSDDYLQTNCSSLSAGDELALEDEQQQSCNESPDYSVTAEEDQYQDFEIGLKSESIGLVDTATLNQSVRLCLNVLNAKDDDIDEKIEMVKSVIKDNMHLQLGTVRENMRCFEQFTKMREDSLQCGTLPEYGELPDLPLQIDGIATPQRYLEAEEYDTESVSSKYQCVNNGRDAYSHNYSLWSKLVSFAYQLVQLNHGNFYYDYGAQFLTAVLACDVLRRGLNRMCDILQRYTCPVKYLTEQHSRASRQTPVPKYYQKQTPNDGNGKTSIQNMNNVKCPSVAHQCSNFKLPSVTLSTKTSPKHIGASNSVDSGIFDTKLESWNFSSKINSDIHASTIWPEELNSVGSAFSSCRTHHTNPMLKVADFIDDILNPTTCGSNL